MLPSLRRAVVSARHVEIVTILTSLRVLAAGSASDAATVAEITWKFYELAAVLGWSPGHQWFVRRIGC